MLHAPLNFSYLTKKMYIHMYSQSFFAAWLTKIQIKKLFAYPQLIICSCGLFGLCLCGPNLSGAYLSDNNWAIELKKVPNPIKITMIMWTWQAILLYWHIRAIQYMYSTYLLVRVLLRLEFQVAHTILMTNLATDQKWPLKVIFISLTKTPKLADKKGQFLTFKVNFLYQKSSETF